MPIAEIICGVIQHYIKFKTPVSVYCSSFICSQCYWKLFVCGIVNSDKSNHCLTAAESVCAYKINMPNKIFSKLDSFVLAFRRTLFDI